MAQDGGIWGQDPSPAVLKGHPPSHYPQYVVNILQAPGQDLTPLQQQTLPAPRVSLPTNHSMPKLQLEKFIFGHGFLSCWSAISLARGE